MAWNDQAFHVEIKIVTDELMHSHIRSTSGSHHEFACTFVYAHNSAKQREELWRDSEYIAQKTKVPWIAMGDYNCILNREEPMASSVRDREMLEFRRCISNCELDHLKSTGDSTHGTINNLVKNLL